ncbi:MAG: OmpA family protein [Armatimonadota bacterium]|nr:OmpA family protein [bacterium]MDW8320255.1 OmpA family protein [Armatimonadota bacterium]
MTRTRRSTRRHENIDRWLITYADMITLLVALFIMLYAMSAVNQEKFGALAQSMRREFQALPEHNGGKIVGSGQLVDPLQQQASQLQRFLQETGLQAQVRVRYEERGLVISLLSDGTLFDLGSADLKPSARQVLDRVAQVLRVVPNPVLIEGHTDNLPIRTPQYPSNWELSAARAARVLRYLVQKGGIASQRVIAVGYADTRPLVPNNSPSNRAQNRRVDIAILKTSQNALRFGSR